MYRPAFKFASEFVTQWGKETGLAVGVFLFADAVDTSASLARKKMGLFARQYLPPKTTIEGKCKNSDGTAPIEPITSKPTLA